MMENSEDVNEVFEWAHVRVATAFLQALPVERDRNKHDVVQHLAVTGGVAMEWDSNSNNVTLKGTWSCILRAQVIFTQYLTNLKTCSSANVESTEETKNAANVTCASPNPQDKRTKSCPSMLSLDSTQSGVSSPVPDLDKLVFSIKSPEKCRLESEVTSNISKAMRQHVEENEVYVNITLSSLPFSVLAAGVKSTNTEELILPLSRESTSKSDRGLNALESNVTPYSVPDLNIKSGFGNDQTSSKNSENMNKRTLKNASASETKCTVSEHLIENSHPDAQSRGDEDIMMKIKQVSQFLKIPDGMHIRTDQGNEAMRELKPDNDSHSLFRTSDSKLGPTSTGSDKVVENVTATLGDCQVSKHLEGKACNENENLKPVKNNSKKKKNYEEKTPFKFFCSICSFKSKREGHYQRHLQLHSQVSQLYTCDKCNFKAIRLGHLRRHELTHSSTTLGCNLCNYRTNNVKFLAKHKRIKHKANEVSEVKEIFQCKHCEYSTSKNYFLQKHQQVHGIGCAAKIQQSHQCDQCQYKTIRREHLVRHASNVHGGLRPFLCHHCGKAFKRQDALKQHAITHISQATVMCPVCGKGCRSKVHLTQHLAIHSTVRSFLCELCGSAFKTRDIQRKHIQTIHQHPKAFFCHHCSRKFNTKYALRRHIKQHSSERKMKPEDQVPRLVPNIPGTIPDVFTTSMRMLQADAIFIQDTPRSHLPDNSTALPVQENPGHHDGEKITVQLAESYDHETLRVIPSHTYVQHSNETATALLYLTGSFPPY